jgi:hypothetical protein
MIVRMSYHPSPPQRLFHETTADEIGYGGELGGGKTKALAMDILFNAVRYPRSTMYVFRATYQQGEDTLLEEIEHSYPKEVGRYNKEDTTFYFVNGSKLKVRQCNSLADAEKNDGKEFNKLYIDEAQHLPLPVFDYLCLRPRANKALGMQPQVKFTAMQGGKGHAWIKRTYIDALEPNVPKMTLVVDDKTGEEFEIYRQFIPAALSDNKHVDRKYAGRLGMRSERNRRKARTNDWNAIEGQVFREWVDKPYLDKECTKPNYTWTHVIPAFETLPEHWPIYRGYDHGFASPYSVLWHTRADESYRNMLLMTHELYGGTEDEEGLYETVSQIAEKIAFVERPLLERHGWIDGVGDPSIFSRSANSEQSIADIFKEFIVLGDIGIIFHDPRYEEEFRNNVINNRLQGISLIHELLRFDADGYPKFQVFDRCVKFRKHFPELVTAKNNPDDVDSDKTADHDYDAFRYVAMMTKPNIKAPVPIRSRRRFDPLGFGNETLDDDRGKVISIPEIKVG